MNYRALEQRSTAIPAYNTGSCAGGVCKGACLEALIYAARACAGARQRETVSEPVMEPRAAAQLGLQGLGPSP